MGKLRSAKSSSNPLFGPQTTTEQCIGLFSSNDSKIEVTKLILIVEGTNKRQKSKIKYIIPASVSVFNQNLGLFSLYSLVYV